MTGPGGGSSGNTTGDGGSTSSVSSTPASSTVGGSTTSTTTEPKRKRAKIDPTVESVRGHFHFILRTLPITLSLYLFNKSTKVKLTYLSDQLKCLASKYSSGPDV